MCVPRLTRCKARDRRNTCSSTATVGLNVTLYVVRTTEAITFVVVIHFSHTVLKSYPWLDA